MSVSATTRVVAVGVAATVLAGCSTLQAEADDEAARIADHVLPEVIDDAVAAAGARTRAERAAAAQDWLERPGPSLMDGQGAATWVVRDREATTIRVDLYRRWESGSFFWPDQGEAAWGVACRVYDVADGVRTIVAECPAGTPDSP